MPRKAERMSLREAERIVRADRNGEQTTPQEFDVAVLMLCDAALAKDAPPNVAEALHAAVAAIYFDDSSDFRGALWNVVRALDPKIADLLENDESAAYDATLPPHSDDRHPPTPEPGP